MTDTKHRTASLRQQSYLLILKGYQLPRFSSFMIVTARLTVLFSGILSTLSILRMHDNGSFHVLD